MSANARDLVLLSARRSGVRALTYVYFHIIEPISSTTPLYFFSYGTGQRQATP